MGEHFNTLRNSKNDFASIRWDACNIIQKLHSDLDHSEEIILTSADYRKIYSEEAGNYYRSCLKNIFHTFDIIIIGHSLKDPDIDYVLQLAKEYSDPLHPIYMIAANCTKADEAEYLEKYNIVLVSYQNDDGTHAKLRRILESTSKFIAPRNRSGRPRRIKAIAKEESDAAASLFIYRRMQKIESDETLSPIILGLLVKADDYSKSFEELKQSSELIKFARLSNSFDKALLNNLDILKRKEFVEEVLGNYIIKEKGREYIQECQALRDSEKELAYGQFSLDIKMSLSGISEEQDANLKILAEKAVINSFSSRGLVIANQVFANQAARSEELSDIFDYVSDAASTMDNMEMRAAFIESMHRMLIEPNEAQRRYLASLSQGYFLYHLLGNDPLCGKIRWDIFQKTLWIFDSSVLLPYLAAGSHNNDYANELFNLLKEANALMYTTPRLIQETWEHFAYAADFVEKNGVDSPEFLRAALVKGSYKQNLFLDGYIRNCADGKIGKYSDYINMVCREWKDQKAWNKHITGSGIRVIEVKDVKGFMQSDWDDLEYTKAEIERERRNNGTYKSTLQVESEAEIWLLVKNIREGKYELPGMAFKPEGVYFVSQSRLLDRIFKPQDISTWSAEALYRYLLTLPEKSPDPDLLHQCMLNEYSYAGVSFVDSQKYKKYFGPSIDAANISFEEEKKQYVQEIENVASEKLDFEYLNTPDLEKPLFIAQMAWKIAENAKNRETQAIEREAIAEKRALEAEAKIRALEAEKTKAWKLKEHRRQEQEKDRVRNLKDAKHLRKRLRQAKKRKKKR